MPASLRCEIWNPLSFIFVFLTCSIRKNSHQNARYWKIKTGLKIGPKGLRFANLNVYALFGPEKLQFRGSGGVNVFLRVAAPSKAHGEVHAMLIAALLSPIIMSAWHLKILSPIQVWQHTPSIAFRHLPPNSPRFGYATEGALFISAQLSTDAVGALRKVWGTNMTVEAT